MPMMIDTQAAVPPLSPAGCEAKAPAGGTFQKLARHARIGMTVLSLMTAVLAGALAMILAAAAMPLALAATALLGETRPVPARQGWRPVPVRYRGR